MKPKHKAFTLAELMIIMAVMTILFAALAPIFTTRITSATSDYVWHFVPNSSSGRSDAYSSHKNIFVTGEYFFGLTPKKSSDVNYPYAPYSKVIINASDNLQGGKGIEVKGEKPVDFQIEKGDMQNQMEFLAYHYIDLGGTGKIGQERVVASIFAGNRNMIVGGNMDGFRANPDVMNPYGLVSSELPKYTKYTFADNTSFGNKTFGCGMVSYEGCMYNPPYVKKDGFYKSYVATNNDNSDPDKPVEQEDQYVTNSSGYLYSRLAFGGMGNTALGYFAAARKAIGKYDVAVGYGANWWNYGSYQDERVTVVGHASAPFVGSDILVVGNNSFPRYNSGSNTIIGNNVGANICKAQYNSAYDAVLGSNSLDWALTSYNTVVGSFSLNNLDRPNVPSNLSSPAAAYYTKSVDDLYDTASSHGKYVGVANLYMLYFAAGLYSGGGDSGYPCYDVARSKTSEAYQQRNETIVRHDPYADVLRSEVYVDAYNGKIGDVTANGSKEEYNKHNNFKNKSSITSYEALQNSLQGENTVIGYNAGEGIRVGRAKTCIGAYSCPAQSWDDEPTKKTPSIYTKSRKYINVLNDTMERIFIGGKPNSAGLAKLNSAVDANLWDDDIYQHQNPTAAYEDYDPVAVLEIHNLTTSHKNPYYLYSNAQDNLYLPDNTVVINGNLIVRGQSYLIGRQRNRIDETGVIPENQHPHPFGHIVQKEGLMRYVTYNLPGGGVGFAGFDGVAGQSGASYDEKFNGYKILFNCTMGGDYVDSGRATIVKPRRANPASWYNKYQPYQVGASKVRGNFMIYNGTNGVPFNYGASLYEIGPYFWQYKYHINGSYEAIYDYDFNYARAMYDNTYIDPNTDKVSNTTSSCFPMLITTSDARLKNVDSPYNLGLEKINKLNVYNYTFKSDKDKFPHVGVIAQDLKRIFPAAVMKNVQGFYHIRWDEMFYSAINAIKELNTKVEKLASRVQSDMDRINALKKDNADLVKKLDELSVELDKLEK